ncbi:MAG: hypothetical protein JWO78_1768 [Micavibrio sp.]|nr:hypothetical protein [Micavibrio sp.]
MTDHSRYNQSRDVVNGGQIAAPHGVAAQHNAGLDFAVAGANTRAYPVIIDLPAVDDSYGAIEWNAPARSLVDKVLRR